MPLKKTGSTAPIERGTMTAAERQLLADARAVGRVPVDKEALGRIYHAYYGLLLGICMKKCEARNDAEDLLQNSFLRVLNKQKAAKFATIQEFNSWLFIIPENLMRNAHRKEHTQKRAHVSQSLDPLTERNWTPPDHAIGLAHPHSVLDEMMSRERREAFDKALRELPDKMQQCARLYFVQGLKQSEIATIMKRSIGTVKSHISKAKQRLLDHGFQPERT